MLQTLQQWVRALETERTEGRATVDWQCTSRQARIKHKRLYPVVHSHQDCARDSPVGGRTHLRRQADGDGTSAAGLVGLAGVTMC
jgi:hypothetical protein